MNKYKVSVCSEDGVVLIIEAKSKGNYATRPRRVSRLKKIRLNF